MEGLTPLTFNFALLIVAATFFTIIARKAKEPPLIAYIATGVILGPVMLDIVSESGSIKLFSKLGLGFLLFLLGLEMKIGSIKKILKPIARIAVLQTVLQTALAFVLPIVLGFNLIESIAIALCTVFGATPVVVKVLADQNKIDTLSGKIDVGVLILQDIYLVIILTLFSTDILANPTQIGFTLLRIFLMVGVISGITFLLSRYVLEDIFEKIAENRESFFIYGLTWAFGFIALGHILGLSIEMGGFLAGLGLGQVPFHREMKEKIEPLTNFFLVIFFASIGLQLTPSNLLAYWKEAVFSSVVLMAGNFAIMFYLIDRENFTPKTSFLGSINMTQVSEFSLVVGGLAITQGYLGQDVLGYFSLMALLTMTASTYLITYNEKIYEKVKHLLKRFESEEKKDVKLEGLEDHAVVIGYNHIAEEALPLIQDNFSQVVVVDRNPKNVSELEEKDVKYFFGDLNHEEIMKSIELEEAKLVLSFEPDQLVNEEILETCGENSLKFVEAEDTETTERYYDLGADYVIRQNLLTAEKMKQYLRTYMEKPQNFKEKMEKNKKEMLTEGGEQ